MLSLNKSLAVIDLETTGTDVETDRIVSIAIVKINTDGSVEEGREWLINPEIAIPPAASKVHGITDEMVKDKPTFKNLSNTILGELKNCDISGFNVEKFDLPLLTNEFKRAGFSDFVSDVAIIDVMKIYHKNESRDLSAAVKYYLNRSFDDAHSAIHDARATAEILIKQVERYSLPQDTKGLHDYCHEVPENYVDPDGKLIMQDGEITINFGKFSGKTVKEIRKIKPDYIQWILGSDFSEEVKKALRAS